MNEITASNSHTRTIVLPQVLDLRAATPLASEFLASRGDQVVIDASNVEKIGAQCIQVILSAAQTWERDGMLFSLTGPSEALVDAFILAGIPIQRLTEQELSK